MFQRFAKRVFSAEGSTCPFPAVSTVPQTELMEAGRHVAMYKGLHRPICDYNNWRIVGVRFDICANRSDFKGPLTTQVLASGRCIQEARLVAQPFVKTSRGDWVVVDTTMHLLYDIPKPIAFIADLKGFAKLSQASLSHRDKKPVSPDPILLTPHSALVADMAHCQNDSTPTKIGAMLARFLGRHFRRELMNGIAWMTSDLSPGVWTFATQKVDGPSQRLMVDIVKERRSQFEKEIQQGQLPKELQKAQQANQIQEKIVQQIKQGTLPKNTMSAMLDHFVGRDQRVDEDCADSFSNEALQAGKFPMRTTLLNEGSKTPCGEIPRVNIGRWFDRHGVAPGGFSFKQYRQDPLVNRLSAMKEGAPKDQAREQVMRKYLRPLKTLDDLARPTAISQLGQRSSNCVSCHLLDQTLNTVYFSLQAKQAPPLGSFLGQPPIWEGFKSKGRQRTNLRNFGYGPGFNYGVSLRTLHETEEVRQQINALFPNVSPSNAFLH